VWASASGVFAAGTQGTVEILTRTNMPGSGAELACNDGYDNDNDGQVDGQDTDCAAGASERCGDLVDDNGNGKVDCADTFCAPLKACKAGGICKPAATIACGQTLGGTTVGAPARLVSYPCVSALEAGPETFYTFTPTGNAMVTATLSGYTGDLDLVLVGSAPSNLAACDPFGQCLAASATTNATEGITFSALANTTYYFVVDGYNGANSAFSLQLICN